MYPFAFKSVGAVFVAVVHQKIAFVPVFMMCENQTLAGGLARIFLNSDHFARDRPRISIGSLHPFRQ